MIKDRIQVLQYDIDLELSIGLPLAVREDIITELTYEIEEAIKLGLTSGLSKTYFEEEISGEYLQTDVDITWNIVNWKEIAERLYKELIEYPNKSESVLKLYRDATEK